MSESRDYLGPYQRATERHGAGFESLLWASPATQEARHAKCLAFIKGHGLECDPWQEPTCGYDLGIMRPLECARPF